MNEGFSEPPKIESAVEAEVPAAAGRLRTWLRDLIISVVVSFFIITFLYQPVKVEGTSMAPRLHDQDRLFINKFAYDFEKIERDDVVVFYYPRDTQKSYIKRVIGLPGDTVVIRDGRVFVNGKEIAEPYVPERYQDVRSMDELHVPVGQYFVMGDHRSISSDSRDFGPVDRKLIYGKAAFVYWPREEIGVVR
jgi:signal peptidase I